MTIYQQLKAAGVPLGSHESDLHAKVTPESERILSGYEFAGNVRQFSSDGERWFDIPFAFDPFWEGREKLPPCAQSMGCLCACHAAGLGADEPCDTSEERARIIADGNVYDSRPYA